MVHGYTPSISGLPKRMLPASVISSYKEQIARRAIHALFRANPEYTVSQQLLQPLSCVYYYEKIGKDGAWYTGYVVLTTDQVVTVSKTKSLRKPHKNIAYEDMRLVPHSSLLKQLDQIELGYDLLPEVHAGEETGSPLELAKDCESSSSDPPLLPSDPELDSVPLFDDDPLQPSQNSLDETQLWELHPFTSTLLARQDQLPLDATSMDVGIPLLPEDIESTPIRFPHPRESLQSSEQAILRDIKDVIGDSPTSESKLQFAPRWIIDKAINAEKASYLDAKAYRPVSIKSLPRDANIISSHHFYVAKYDGKSSKLKVKCRLVPHGNRDAEKDAIRSDSSTAQFPCIRLLLSLATLFHFQIGGIDVSRAFLQSGSLERNIYMRPPRGWTTHVDEI